MDISRKDRELKWIFFGFLAGLSFGTASIFIRFIAMSALSIAY